MERDAPPSASPAETRPRFPAARPPAVAALALLVLPWSPGSPPTVLAPSLPLGPLSVPAVTILVALAPALALYRRLQREDVLASSTRRSVLAALRETPGATVGGLSRRLDLDYKTVAHHVRVLDEFGLANPRRDGRLRRWYPAGTAPRRPGVPLRGAPATALDLLRLVLAEPGIPQAEVARRLGVSPSTVSWHVGNLVEAEVLEDPQGCPGLRVPPEAAWVRDALPGAPVEAAS